MTTFAYLYNNGNVGNCVRQTGDGNYVVLGGEDRYGLKTYEVWDPDSSDWKRNADIFLMKTGGYGNVIWQKHIGTDTTRETGNWFEITPDNGFIIVGSSTPEKYLSSFPENMIDSSDIVAVKTDANGVIEWSKKFDSGKDDYGFCVQVAADSGYIISGFTDSNPVSVSVTTRAWVIRLNAAGDLMWEAKFEFGIRDLTNKKPFPYFAKELMNHDLAIVGTTAGAHAADLYVIRTDSVGNVIWANSYEDPLMNFSGGYDLVERPDSSLIVCGFRDKDRMMMQYNYPYIVKLSASGTYINGKLFDYTSFRDRTGFSSVMPTSDGNFIFTGAAGYGEMGMEIILLKTDSNLNKIWSRHYDAGGTILGGAKKVIQTQDGGFALTGIFNNAGVNLLKLDTIGNIACNLSDTIIPIILMTNRVSKSPDTLQGIIISSWNPTVTNPSEDSTAICSVTGPLAAFRFSLKASLEEHLFPLLEWKFDLNFQASSFSIMKNKGNIFEQAGELTGNAVRFLDPDPLENPTWYYILATGVSGEIFQSESVQVFPDFHSQIIRKVYVKDEILEIKINSRENQNLVLRVMDISGKRLFQENFINPQTEISLNVADMAAGLYVLTLTDNFGNQETRKFALGR